MIFWLWATVFQMHSVNTQIILIWMTAMCIIAGGWDLHSSRGGDSGWRYSIQVSMLKLLFHYRLSGFFVFNPEIPLTRYSLWSYSGICREGDHLVVGPTDSGQFHQLTVGSIQRNRSACRVLRAGQAATLALGNFDRSLLRKVRLRACLN